MTPGTVQIRRATAEDLPAARALFAVRGRTDEAGTDDARGPDLDNPRRALWLAFDGGRAIGMTSVHLRTLTRAGEERPVAYWTGLFVDPGCGSNFVYPQLLLTMFKGLRELGIRHMYAAVRRQQVAEGHLKVGFLKIGDLAVLARPLRPARLLATWRGWLSDGAAGALLRALCTLPDALFAAVARLQTAGAGATQVETTWSADECAELARLAEAGIGTGTCQRWSTELVAARFGSLDAGYRRIVQRVNGALSAAVLLRIVERGGGVRAAVLLDILHRDGDTAGLRAVVAGAERLALDEDCDVLLWLDGVVGPVRAMFGRRGYVRTPEKYALLARVDRGAESGFLPTDTAGWRFAFADHDTF
jgi:hypothetical protein